jgi:hypothetical protein
VGARSLAVFEARLSPGARVPPSAMMARMYVPAHFKPDDAEIRELLGSGRAANLITATSEGLMATMLPLVWDGPDVRPELGPWGALLGHVARNNGQWKTPAIGEALVLLAGPDAYVSPAWYATKREHGRSHLELHHRPRARPACRPRRPDLGRGERSPSERSPRGVAR